MRASKQTGAAISYSVSRRESLRKNTGDNMQKTSMLLMVVGGILSACIAFESAPRRHGDGGFERGAPESWRGAIGSYCPPKQATKGYC
jgi:hypothetical protein